jgi:hypothetical protein
MTEFRRQMMTDFDVYLPRLACADISSLQMPVLLVRGAGTLPVFTRTIDAIAQCLPTARVVTMPTGPGHGAITGQNPAGLNTAILEFLRSVARQP